MIFVWLFWLTSFLMAWLGSHCIHVVSFLHCGVTGHWILSSFWCHVTVWRMWVCSILALDHRCCKTCRSAFVELWIFQLGGSGKKMICQSLCRFQKCAILVNFLLGTLRTCSWLVSTGSVLFDNDAVDVDCDDNDDSCSLAAVGTSLVVSTPCKCIHVLWFSH